MTHSTHSGRGHPARDRTDPQSPPLKNDERARSGHTERHIDKTLEDTFPASDPPATGGATRIDPSRPGGKHRAHESDGRGKRG